MRQSFVFREKEPAKKKKKKKSKQKKLKTCRKSIGANERHR
jgi:hypothetical protein